MGATLGLRERKSWSPVKMCAGDVTFKFCRRRVEYRWNQLYHDTRILWNEGCGKACERPLWETNGGEKLQEETDVWT